MATLGVMGYDGCAASPSPYHSMPPKVGLDPFISGRPFFGVCEFHVFARASSSRRGWDLKSWKLGNYEVSIMYVLWGLISSCGCLWRSGIVMVFPN